MSIAILQEPAVLSAARTCTVWGFTPMELHDRYWTTMGVGVVRPGAEKLPAEPGLYLLLGAATTAILDFRKVLDHMGWLTPALCSVRAVKPPARPGMPAGGTAARCAFTPSAELAGAWRMGEGGHADWRQLKRRVAAEARTIARPLGRVLDGAPDGLLLDRLAHLWEDPTLGVPGLKARRGVFALDGEAAGERPGGSCRRVWLGRGRSLADVKSGAVCVLADGS